MKASRMSQTEHRDALEDQEDADEGGYETGMLLRVREWTDLFSWVRLGRTMRLAGSPPHLLAVALTLGVWSLVLSVLAAPLERPQASAAGSPAVDTPRSETAGGRSPSSAGEVLLRLPTAKAARMWQRSDRPWRRAALAIWTVVAWSPVTLLLCRQGAILSAGRDLGEITAVGWLALRRSPAAWLVAALPLVPILILGFVLGVAGWIERLSGLPAWLVPPAALVSALIALPAGLVAFGAIVAVPLGLGAIANEADGDAVDALSRGYEYFLRRPLRLALYLLVAAFPLLVMFGLAHGVAVAARLVSESFIGSASESGLAAMTIDLIGFLPVVVILTLSWGLVGGIYLLLRQDAGGQEPEDLWYPPTPAPPPLPTLPASRRSTPTDIAAGGSGE